MSPVGLIVIWSIILAMAALFSSMKGRSSVTPGELSAHAGNTAATAASDTDPATTKDEKMPRALAQGFVARNSAGGRTRGGARIMVFMVFSIVH
jgi:hypothetical protein